MPRVRYVVRGEVQGVGFRWFVWREAERLGVAGFARNLRDGSVEVVAEGSAEAVTELERALRRGPSLARVEAVEPSHVPAELELPSPFAIK